MNGLVDTHFHLASMMDKGVDIFSLQLDGGMDIGCEPEDIIRRLPLIERFPSIVYSVAAGPWCLDSDRTPEQLVDELVEYNRSTHPSFIGEIGLDYYWKYGTVERQKELFIRQMELADEMELPVALHIRDAEKDTIEILERHTPRKAGILHCFSGTWALAETALERNYMLSFAGNVTYRANAALQEIAATIPLDRLLLETDSPYLAPVPFRGKTNTPHLIEHTYRFVAQRRGISVEELKEAVRKNFQALLHR